MFAANVSLFSPQFQKHLTDDVLRNTLTKRLSVMLRESAHVLFPTTPWAAAAFSEARKPWPMPARRGPDGNMIDDEDGDGGSLGTPAGVLAYGEADGGEEEDVDVSTGSALKRARMSTDASVLQTPGTGYTDATATPRSTGTGRRSRAHMTPIPLASPEPYIPAWYSGTAIVNVGFVATLAAGMLPEMQSDLVSVLVQIGMMAERPAGDGEGDALAGAAAATV